ncbi:MAG: response regulator [Candidatus Aenigmarchaeota archaeon]|nr:response regulator [Candidatus Aenigmarchaeota archaeon]
MRQRKKQKVLIVEDDKFMLDALMDVLKEAGYDTQGVTRGFDAIREVERTPFDLIVMDIKLPDIDGVETLKKIREIEAKREEVSKGMIKLSKAMIITGYASEESAVQALRLGAKEYLYKPFELEDFLKSVKKILEEEAEVVKMEDLQGRIQALEAALKEVSESEKKYRDLAKAYMRLWSKKLFEMKKKEKKEKK